MGLTRPDLRFTEFVQNLPPGAALDLACGSGRHSRWLATHGWRVTAVDIQPVQLPGVTFLEADLERGGFAITPGARDLIVCWLYWQADLLFPIAQGIRDCGGIALAGKTSGRFATSLASYRAAFAGWVEIDAAEDERMAWFIARRC